MNISSEETYLPLHNTFMKQCYFFLLLTNGIQMILHLYAFYFWYNCQNSFLKAPSCIIYAHLMMVDCHSGSLTKCFWILCYISERLLIHMQPMWLVLCPLTIPATSSFPVIQTFLNAYPKSFFFLYPIHLITVPKGFSPRMNYSFLHLLLKHAFPSSRGKGTMVDLERRSYSEWSC